MSEHTVARISDLEPGKLAEVDAGGTPVALARDGDRVYAVQAKCPHYGLPLKDGGTVVDGRVRCPYHMSCFRAADGVCVEPPALDGLTTYPCRVEASGNVIVDVPSGKQPGSVPPPMPRKRAKTKQTVVIVGSGAAGYAAAQRFCELGFDGRVVMVSDDPSPLPYDRPSLSKAYFTGQKPAKKLTPRDESFFEDHAIERVRGRAIALDVQAKSIALDDDERTVRYDVAILAPGGTPIGLDVPGGDLARVLTLRSRVDCEQILGSLKKTKRAVVVGSSFIGTELAVGLRIHEVDVTVVSSASTCFEGALGAKVGRLFQQLHEANGVAFRFGTKVARVEGKAQAERVVLDTGETIDCDLVIVGIGVKPATDWLKGSIAREKDGGIAVDETMRAKDVNGVYVVGDAARAPARIEHWRVAQQHGRRAAEVIAGRDTPIVEPPYFWSNQYQASLHYIGHAGSTDDVRLDGESAEDFLAEYYEDGKLTAIASVGRKAEVMRRIEAMRRPPTP